MAAPFVGPGGGLSAAAYAGMLVFGMVMALLGAVMPVLSERLTLGLGEVGTLFLVMNGAMLATSLGLGLAMDRFGLKAPLTLGAGLVAGALLAIATTSEWSYLLAAVACLGVGGGALNGSTNTLVADLHEEPRQKASALNLLGVFFGFGALLLPFSLGALISRVGLAGVLFGAAGLCAATGLMAATLRFPPPKQTQVSPLAQMPRFARHPLVLALACLLFFQSGNEFVLGGYFATFLTRDLAVPIAEASYLLAAYWAAIMASRLLLSRAVLRFGGDRIVLGGAVLAAAGALMVGAAGSRSVAVAGIVLTALALAGIFPTVLGLAGSAFQRHSGTVFGILFTAALTGGMTMPWLAGHLAESMGLRVVFFLVAANFMAVALFNRIARQVRAAGDPQAPATRGSQLASR